MKPDGSNVDANSSSHPNVTLRFIVIVLICAAIILYGFFLSTNIHNDIAYLIGYNIPISLGIWSILYFSLIRGSGRKIAASYFVLVLISLITSNLIGYYQQKRLMQSGLYEFERYYREMTLALTTWQEPSDFANVELQPYPNDKDFGVASEFIRFMWNLLNDSAAKDIRCLVNIDEVGWNKILDLERLSLDESFAQSDDIIIKTKRVIERCAGEDLGYIDGIERRIKELKLDVDMKKSMIEGFLSTSIENRGVVEEEWKMEIDIINLIAEMIDFLRRNQASWTIDNDRIIFFDEHKLREYNQRQENLRKILVSINDSRETRQENMNAQFQELLSIIK